MTEVVWDEMASDRWSFHDGPWELSIREVLIPNPRWPVIHEWMVIHHQGIYIEGSVGSLENAKRLCEVSYLALRADFDKNGVPA